RCPPVPAGIETAGVVGEGDLSIGRHDQQSTSKTEITQVCVISCSAGKCVPRRAPGNDGPLTPVEYRVFYLVYERGGGAHECQTRPARPAERGTEVRAAAAPGVRGQDRGGVAAQRRAWLHHTAAAGARRAGRDRAGERRGSPAGLPDHRGWRPGACSVAADPTADGAAAAR